MDEDHDAPCSECGKPLHESECYDCKYERAYAAINALRDVIERHKIIISPIHHLEDSHVVHPESAFYVYTEDAPDGVCHSIDYFPNTAFYHRPREGSPVVDVCFSCEGEDWAKERCKVCNGSGKFYYENYKVIVKDLSD